MDSRCSSIISKASALASSMFYREMRVPSIATGDVIGKQGSTIKSFRNTPGISSVKLSSGRVEIRGVLEEAVEGVVMAIERLLCNAVSRSEGFHPEFFVTCFCKSLAEPLLAVNKICFEKFAGEIGSSHRDDDRLYLCFKTGAIREGSTRDKLSDDIDSLCAQFSSKMGMCKPVFSSHWDFSAFKTTLLSCLKYLRSEAEYETIKLVVRFGKLLFDMGPNLSKHVEQAEGHFVSLSRLRGLYMKRELNSFFSTACSDRAVSEVRLHLERLQYVKVSSGKEISLHVADLDLVEGQPHRYNVSVRCEMSKEGPLTVPDVSSSAAVITRVRRMPMGHGFVSFCREGQTTSDFRLEIATHEMGYLKDIDIPQGMVDWVEQAWRDRTSDQLLVFPPPGRFLIINIRYKNTETYFTEDFKFRISQVAGGDRTHMMGNKKWECKLSSRWFKSNYGVAGTHTANSSWEDVESAVEYDVHALIKEAVKFSEVIFPCA